MKEGVVFVKENSFIYKDSEYIYDEISEKNMIFKRLKAVILEEMLYIKTIQLLLHGGSMEKYITDKIIEIFPQNGEILYDYEKQLNCNLVYVYSVKGKQRVEKLCSQSKYLEVIPIQFIIRKALKKVLNNKTEAYMAVAMFENSYYFIECSNGVFVDNLASKSVEEIYKHINGKCSEGKIFIDESCFINEYSLKKMEIIKMDIVGLINEVL